MMNLANKLNDPLFETLRQLADQNELEAYVIGGYVRDLLLQRPSKDVDIVVVGDGIRLAEALKETWGKRAHLSVFKNYGTAQVKRGNIEVEFVALAKSLITKTVAIQRFVQAHCRMTNCDGTSPSTHWLYLSTETPLVTCSTRSTACVICN